MREYALQQTATLLRRFAFQVNRAARHGNAEAIHDLRVAIRRLSRCLKVFSQFYPDQHWKRIRRQLSGLMEMAGQVRDRDIALELLAEARVSKSAPVVRRLEDERRRAAAGLALEIRRWHRQNRSKKWRSSLGL